jgi:putative peptide zinc metalloprotease protein
VTEPGVARRAKLELLVRSEGDSGFELREIPSAIAYLQLHPQRLDEASWELAEFASSPVDPRTTYVLRNKATDRYILLSEPERFLWGQMDGTTTVQEMATAYVLRFGTFDFDVIPHLIAKLRRAGLLTLRPASRLREALARNRRHRGLRVVETVLTGLERITVSSRRVHPFFARLYRFGGWMLFTPFAVGACALLTVFGALASIQLWPDAANVAAPLARHPIIAILAVKVLFFATLAAHQIVHGLALIHYGRRVREFGFTFMHGFVPTFYVDVTDIFMASRRARLVTALSGALAHAVLGAVWLVIAAQLPHGLMQAFAGASGLIQLQALVLSLYPFCFIEMDGYHVLVDLLGQPTLKHDAVQFVRDALWRNLTDRRGLSREEGIWVGYVALSFVSIVAFIAFNLVTIIHVVTG